MTTSSPAPPLADRDRSHAISASAANALVVELHAARSEPSLLDVLRGGLAALGLRAALYLADPRDERISLRGVAFPPAVRFFPALSRGPRQVLDALLDGRPRLLADPATLPLLVEPSAPAIAALGPGRWAALPLRQGRATLGYLVLFGARLGPADADALARLSEHLALALARLRSLDHLDRGGPAAAPGPPAGRHPRTQEIAGAISRALNEPLDLRARLQSVLDAVLRFGIADGAALIVRGGTERLSDIPLAAGLEPEWADALHHRRFEGLDLVALRGRETTALPPTLLARLLGPGPLPATAGAWVGVPLEQHGQVEGLLLLCRQSEGGRFTADRRLAAAVGRELATGIARARQYAAQRETADLSLILLEVARSLAAQTDLGHVLSTIGELTPRLIGCTRGVVWRYDAERGVVLPWHGSGLDARQRSIFQSVLLAVADVPFLDRVLCAGQSLVVDEAALDLLPRWMVEFFDIRSILFVPLISKGRPLGLLAVDRPAAPHPFSQRDVAVVEGVASHAALAVDNARLYEQTVRRADQLASLYESGRALSASLPLAELLVIVCEYAARLVNADWCTLAFLDEKNDQLVPMQSWSAAGGPAPGPSLSGLDLARQTVRSGQSAVVEHGESIGSTVSIPLLAKGRVIGALDLLARLPGAFAADEVRLLEAFAGQAAASIENGRLFQQLAAGKRDWEETFDAITDGICVRDQDCRVVRANRALAAIVGAPVASLIGVRLCDLLPELHEHCAVCRRTLPEAQPAAGEVRRSGPEPLVLTVHDYPVHAPAQGQVRWVTVFKDVTTERRIQDTLIRSEKMRALGEMASGVAHDFNNLLAAILARAELSLLEEPCPDGKHGFETIRRAALDGVAVVRRIQEYSRVRHDRERRHVDINDIIRSAVELTRHKWKDGPERAGIHLDLHLALHPVPLVQGNAAEFREVLINLIFNAVDAMPQGGSLRISTGVSDDRVVITAADTGTGMPEEIQRRVFDPFFTTKGEGGSGLGLSVSYGIVARYGGDIALHSEPGRGTTFTIRLPCSQDDQEQAAPAEGIVGPVPPARIMLVDDDPDVLESVAELLRRDGHRVTAFNSSRQALARFQPDEYDYIVSDLGMPELNGWELAAGLRELAPHTPIFLLTGWHAELSAEHAVQQGISAVLSKPCTLPDLRRAMAAHPVASPAAERPPTRTVPSPAPAPAATLRILVVDDQPQLIAALSGRLQLEGHTVVAAETGRAGLARLAEGPFDLAIVDLRLPDIEGTEVIAAARALAAPPYCALATGMAISASDTELIGGADDVLPKPWTADELRRVLDSAARRRHTTA